MTTEIILRKLFLFMESTFVAGIFAALVVALFLPFCLHHVYRVLLKTKDKLTYKKA